MACSNCKKKEKMDELMKTGEFIGKAAIWVFVIWTLLGFYGVYSLITKFI
jgi:hypothetical protein